MILSSSLGRLLLIEFLLCEDLRLDKNDREGKEDIETGYLLNLTFQILSPAMALKIGP